MKERLFLILDPIYSLALQKFMSNTILKRLTILHYKNIESETFDFEAKINCFLGKNGVGKTNLLDAIYHLSFGKSYSTPSPLKISSTEKSFSC